MTLWGNFNERTFTYRATMQHRLMPNRHVGSELKRKSWICVQDGTVLNICAVANRDWLVVGSQYGLRSDATARSQSNAADDGCAVRHVRALVDPGLKRSEGIYRHVRSTLLSKKANRDPRHGRYHDDAHEQREHVTDNRPNARVRIHACDRAGGVVADAERRRKKA